MPIEVFQRFRRNPKFCVLLPADNLNRKLLQVIGVNAELRHKADKAVALGIPVAGDLLRVLKVRHRIENRLVNEARRERGILRTCNQL